MSFVRFDDAWLAGLFEGEGCIYHRGRSVTLHITSTDADVLDTVLQVAGVGQLTRWYTHSANPSWKPFRRWEVRGIVDAQALLIRLRPHLHGRRGDKADAVLALTPTVDPTRPGRHGGKDGSRLCRSGRHPMAGARTCLPCRRERERRINA